MTRFEIQDIIRQNQDGVTFRALDKSNDQIVSLRRFFPFGQCDENEEGGEGLDPKEGKAFSTACERLSHIRHPALRRTIFGDIDPIDGMPYLVTEWIEGESLSNVLGSNTMPADMTIALVQQVFDVCKLLSETLQSEAIWIDTNPQSIIVCNPTENPTFSFRICPFKWLGTSRAHLKDMSSIVSLIEALMGWKSKLVSDQAGKGLGGYIKLLRQYPEMDINKAIQSLPNHSYEVVEVVSETNTKTPTTLFPPIPSTKVSFLNKKSITIMCISAFVTGALIFFFYQQRSKQTDQNMIVESEVYDPANDPAFVSKPEITSTISEIDPIAPETTETNPENTGTTDNITKDQKENEPASTEVKTDPKKTETSLKSTSWSPAEISTAAWYDASETSTIKAIDGLVSQWNDISGNNNHATQSTSAFQPKTGTRTINNLNAIDFDIDTLSRVELDMAGKAIFAVVLADNTGDGGQIFSHSSNKVNNQLRITAGGRIRYAASLPRYSDSRPSTATLTMNQPGIAGFILNTTMQFSVNGAFDDTGASEVSTASTVFDQFGARGEKNAEALDGLIGEIIITNSIPDTDARQKIEGYLAHKWGLTANLPADHPHKTLAPVSSASAGETIKHLPLTEKDSKETKKTDPKTAAMWSPTDIPFNAWYDASTATIKDGTVSIPNAGSNGGAISGPASLAANGIGNLQAVQFNGINQYLTGDCNNAGTTLTVFFVGKSLNTNQAPFAGMMSIWENNQNFDWNNAGSAVLFSQNDTIANSIYTHRNQTALSSATGELTTDFLASAVFNGSTHTFYLNGNPSTAVPSANSFNADKVIIGARWQQSAIAAPYWNGRVGEVIISNADMSTSDRQKIEGYLAHKWGLTGNLPANHPYKSSAPASQSSKPETLVNLPTKKNPIQKPKTTPQNIRSWSPDEVSTTAWYDASDASTITASSSAVSQWRDKSGNGLHLAQGKSANQPSTGAKINGLNALDFTLDAMTTAKNPFGTSVSNAFVIAVYKVDSIQNGTLFSLTGSENHTSRWNAQAPYGDKFMYFDCGGVIPGSTRVSTTDYGVTPGNAVLASFYSSTTHNVQQVYKNGSLLAGDRSGHAVSTSGNISVGGVATSYQDATIGEMIIINGTVDEATRQKLEGYLAHKWGTTSGLPANHPYKSSVPIPSVLISSDAEIIKTLEVGDPVTLQGVVKSAKFSSTGKSIYLSFSDPEVESDVRVVIHGSEYDGTAFTEEEFAKLIGKNLVFSGTVYTENFNDRPPFVKITEKAQIKLATKTIHIPKVTEKPINRPIFTPDDAAALAKLNLKDPAAVRGVVKSVKIPNSANGLYFSFSDPFDRKQIQVVAYPNSFDDKSHDSASFKKIEAEFQHLVGKTVTFNGSVSRQDNNSFQFVYISKREHIVVEDGTEEAKEINPENQNDNNGKKGMLAKLQPGTRLKIQGNLNTVKYNSDKTAILLSFFDPSQEAPITGIAYKTKYKDPFDIENFRPLEGKHVSIDGILTVGDKNSRFIEITNFNQISNIQK